MWTWECFQKQRGGGREESKCMSCNCRAWTAIFLSRKAAKWSYSKREKRSYKFKLTPRSWSDLRTHGSNPPSNNCLLKKKTVTVFVHSCSPIRRLHTMMLMRRYSLEVFLCGAKSKYPCLSKHRWMRCLTLETQLLLISALLTQLAAWRLCLYRKSFLRQLFLFKRNAGSLCFRGDTVNCRYIMSAAYDCPAFLSCGQRLEGWISIYEESFLCVCVCVCVCAFLLLLSLLLQDKRSYMFTTTADVFCLLEWREKQARR